MQTHLNFVRMKTKQKRRRECWCVNLANRDWSINFQAKTWNKINTVDAGC